MLRGERIVLRAMRRDDLPAICEFNNDLSVESLASATPGMPQSLERLQSEFDQSAAKGGRDGTGFVIDLDGKVIGHCRLTNLNESKGVAHCCELGIVIGDKSCWGRGFGREAIRLLLWYAFQCWNVQRVGLTTNSANKQAIACYLASGFVEEGRLRRHEWHCGRYLDTVCMGILREEWERIQERENLAVVFASDDE